MRASAAGRRRRCRTSTIAHAGDIAPIYLHIVLSEAAAYHAKTLETRGDDYTPNVRQRLEMGRYILAEDYVRALRGRDVLTSEVDAALTGCDGLLLPSLPIPAHKIGVLDGAHRRVRRAGSERHAATDAAVQPDRPSRHHGPLRQHVGGIADWRADGRPTRTDAGAARCLAGALEPYLGPGTSR